MDTMTLDHVRERVASIATCAGNDEIAHSMDDELRDEFLKHVAEHGPSDLAAMAREILTVNDIQFSRRYA